MYFVLQFPQGISKKRESLVENVLNIYEAWL